MAKKRAQLPIRKKGNSWTFSVPARFSPSGKRYRPHFPTKGQAVVAREKILTRINRYGTEALALPPTQAEDALAALAILPEGMTLAQCVREAVARAQSVETSLTVAEILDRHFQIKAGVEIDPLTGGKLLPRSEATLENLRRFGGKLKEKIGGENVATLTPEKMRVTMNALFKTPTVFNTALGNINPAFAYAVKVGWAPANPLDGITKREVEKREVDFLTPDEAPSVLAACTEHRGNPAVPDWLQCDCTPCAVPFALLMFAGIRPDELRRLRGRDIDLHHGEIRVPAKASKTSTLRFVPISNNLRAWIERGGPLAPDEPIVPENWNRRYKCVRFVCGLNKRQGDALRHTFATMFLGAGHSMDELVSAMGHTTSKTTLKHYVNAVRKRDALRFWNILPEGAPSIREVVA